MDFEIGAAGLPARRRGFHNGSMETDNRIAINRALVGILALGSLAAGGAILYVRGMEGDVLGPSLVRIGIVLGAIWLALPTKNREAAWARVSPVGLGFVLLSLLALTSKRFVVLVPILIVAAIVGFLLKPRPRR
ncbi:MAG: hypothetical protein WD066_00760 [Planctomycetaceae bacterium]